MRWTELEVGDVVVPPAPFVPPWLVLGVSAEGILYVILTDGSVDTCCRDDRDPPFAREVKVFRGVENVNK